LTPAPSGYGEKTEKAVQDDLRSGGSQLKLAVTALLRQQHNLAIKPEYFSLKIHDEGQYFAAETNLAKLCRLPDSEVDEIIEMAIPALATTKLRIEEMQMHSSLTEFDEDDLEFFDSMLGYLIDRDNSGAREQQFRRVIKVLDLPDIPSDRFDAQDFLELRTSSECQEFRDWLTHVAECSDAEITRQVNGFRERCARFYQTRTGKALRILVPCALGLIHPMAAGVGLGLGEGVLDYFVLDKILRPSGAIAFISSGYPSVFKT
jgi:hypothetical protein